MVNTPRASRRDNAMSPAPAITKPRDSSTMLRERIASTLAARSAVSPPASQPPPHARSSLVPLAFQQQSQVDKENQHTSTHREDTSDKILAAITKLSGQVVELQASVDVINRTLGSLELRIERNEGIDEMRVKVDEIQRSITRLVRQDSRDGPFTEELIDNVQRH